MNMRNSRTFRARRRFLAVVFLIIGAAVAVAGQTRGVGVPVRQPDASLRNEVLYGASYALVIGNSRYTEWNDLPGVESDVELIERLLRERHGFEVEKALDLSKPELLQRIDRFISRYGQRYENRLLIYYAGHGYSAVLGNGNKMGYLVTKDAPAVPPVEQALLKTPDNIGDFRLHAISMSEIANLANEVAARHAMFVFDSCFAGTVLFRDNTVEVPKEISTEELEQMRGFLTAGNERQRVRDDSPFRRAFVKGLEGAADLDRDGFILSSELGMFVKREVTLATRGSAMPQSPIFGKHENFNRGEMIFVVPGPNAANVPAAKLPAANTAPTTAAGRAAATAERALGEMLRGNFESARRLADEARALDGESALALAVGGWAKYGLTDFEAALVDLEKAVRREPRNPLFQARLAMAYQQLGRNEAGDRAATAAFAALAAPQTALDFYARGVVNNYRKNSAAEIEDYRRAIELDPQFALAYNNRGRTYLESKNYEAALRDFTKAIELNPQSGFFYLNRGLLRRNQKKFDEAIRDFTTAAELAPRDVRIYWNRGYTYADKGDYAAAIADLTKVVQISPKDDEAYYTRGAYYEQLNDLDAAVRDFTKAIEIKPQNPYAYNGRGNAYFKMSEMDAAVRDYTKAIELDPKFSFAYLGRGSVLYNRKDYDAALRDFNKAIEYDPKSSQGYSRRGGIFYNRNDYDAAIRDFSKAIELDSEDAYSYRVRGLSYLMKEDFQSALRDFEKLVALEPAVATAYLARGGALAKLERHEAAIRDFSKAIGLDPKLANAYLNRSISYAKLGRYELATADQQKYLELTKK